MDSGIQEGQIWEDKHKRLVEVKWVERQTIHVRQIGSNTRGGRFPITLVNDRMFLRRFRLVGNKP